MALFTLREVKEGKPIILNELRNSGTLLFTGARWSDYSDKDFISLTCDEDDFGPGFKKWFGYGSYEGSVSVGYTPREGYLKMEVYFGANTMSMSTIEENAKFSSSMMKFNIECMRPGTNGLNHPYICISKTGVQFSELQQQVNNMIVAMGFIVDATN